MWKNIKDEKPPIGQEVLVWVDGHRGPLWTNNYALVAFLNFDGNFWEERHPEEPVVGVIYWKEIEFRKPQNT